MDLDYQPSNTSVNDILHYAQTIANAFSNTLEANNCLLMLSVGLHQDLDNNIKDVITVVDIVTETNNILEGDKPVTPDDILNDMTDSLKNIKAKCFDCDIDFPKIDFDLDLGGSLGKLKASVNLYKSIFKFNKFDLCQTGFALQSACVPDILKLITLLLTAYVSIMSLKKLSNISISAFIKGVLSTLLSKLVTNLKISVNIGSSNIGCLVDALREIALALPTQRNISNNISGQDVKDYYGLSENEDGSINTNFLKNEMIDNVSSTLYDSARQLEDIEDRLEATEEYLNDAFDLITNVVDDATQEINNYVQSLLAFQTFFECEVSRSGMELEEGVIIINKLIQVINLLSAVAMSLVKKDLREDACRNSSTINNLSDTEIEDLLYKDLIEDYNKKVVEITNSDNNDISILIYDEPKSESLPKIDLLDCSIDDFIDSHTLPKIIESAKKQLEDEVKQRTSTSNFNTYSLKKPTLGDRDIMKNIVDIIYEKPKEDVETPTIPIITDPIINPIGLDSVSDILSDVLSKDKKKSDLSCKSVEDVMDILNSLKR